MKLLLTGPIEGSIEKFYLNTRLGEEDHQWVVCTGSYGIWPDPQRMDKASREHGCADFSKYYVAHREVPTPTLVIAGAHDDNRWLEQRRASCNLEILQRVHWLAQGYKTDIGWDSTIRVTGLGRAYSELTYNDKPTKKAHRHYTRQDVERACASGPTDLLVLYEHLDAPGLRNVIFATRPKLILNVQHPNTKSYTEVQETPVIQLGKNETKIVEWKDTLFHL